MKILYWERDRSVRLPIWCFCAGVECAKGVQAVEGDRGRDVTTLLLAWSHGDREALNELTPLIYTQLRQMAAQMLRRERAGHTLQSTALVHEVYLKLVDQEQVQWNDRAHFFAVASRIIRHILVSHARAHKASKRGGGLTRLQFDEAIALPGNRDADLVALDDALEVLTRMDQQQGRIVELRFFGGLSIEGTAHVLGISPATVKRDWSVARGWLFRELSRGGANAIGAVE